MKEQSIYQLALTRMTGIGPVLAKRLVARFGNAESVFRADGPALRAMGIGKDVIAGITGFNGWPGLEAELALLETKSIRLLFLGDKDYPRRLQNIGDAPPLLFYRGNADLNAKRIIAVVGTRIPSDYGRKVTVQLVRQLAQPDILIISGLALGIDAAAHKAAIDHQLPTVGILGHGFGHFYPPENKELSDAMLQNGGLLTSFAWSTKPDAWNFPTRNELVAALCDALVVVETARKGGSLGTVEHALKYGRPVFAVPGRITDTRSAGCNWLIRQGMAQMLTSGDQLSAALGWNWPNHAGGLQATLPLHPSDAGGSSPEDRLLALLKEKDSLSIDELSAQSGLAPSALALWLVHLELRGLINALPGKRYRFNSSIIRA